MKRAAVLLALAMAAPVHAKKPLPPEPAVLQGLRIHEWGVFLAGGEAAIAGGGGDSPTFVQRVSLPPGPPAERRGDVECLEPVIHVYAPGPLKFRVQVAFPGGTPLLAWPRSIPGWSGRSPSLSWTLRTGGEGEPAPPRVPEEHWISACRRPGSDFLRSEDGKDAERFLFYEGKVDYAPQVRIRERHKDAFGITSSCIREAWVIQGGEELRRGIGRALDEIEGSVRVAPVPCEPAALRAELSAALAAEGLSEAEAGALLDIWMPHLAKAGSRLAYVLPREEYDRILPIAFDPAPEELVRIGLVLQEIQP